MLPIAILAGGFATRLGSLTKDFPKCLIEINGRPFIDWQMDLLVAAGYSEFVFCLSYKSEMVQEHLHDGKQWGVNVKYSLDGETQLGTGGAVKKALPLLGEEFALIYGDSYLPVEYSEIETAFKRSADLALMTIYRNGNEHDASNVEFTDGKLVNYEKGRLDPKMQYIDYGLTHFRAEAFRQTLNQQAFDLSEICHKLASEKKMSGFEVFNRFYEIGSVQGIQDISDYLGKAPHEF
jgi:N-acetyl-alpha-D-muramate 1-phosphate uridylyltransferase